MLQCMEFLRFDIGKQLLLKHYMNLRNIHTLNVLVTKISETSKIKNVFQNNYDINHEILAISFIMPEIRLLI